MFALSSSFAIALAALVVLGASDMVSVVIRMTLVQLGTPDEMRGRVTSVNALFIGASNQLGEFRAGAAAAWLGAVPTVLIGGVGTLIIVTLWMWLFPPLVRIDRLEDVKPNKLVAIPAQAAIQFGAGSPLSHGRAHAYSAAVRWRCTPHCSQWSRKSDSQARMPWS